MSTPTERRGRRFSMCGSYPWRQASMRGVWPSELRASSMPCTDLAAAWASRGVSKWRCLDAVSMMRSEMWSCPLAAGDRVQLNADLPYVQLNIHRLAVRFQVQSDTAKLALVGQAGIRLTSCDVQRRGAITDTIPEAQPTVLLQHLQDSPPQLIQARSVTMCLNSVRNNGLYVAR